MIALCILLGLGTSNTKAEIVKAENYRAFWLWAGVKPQPVLSDAQEIYLLAGEVMRAGKPHIVSQRSDVPHVRGSKVWIVYRVQTLAWNEAIFKNIISHIKTWQAAGNDLVGLQIDFDAGTKHLDQYAEFLIKLRTWLPDNYHLGVTGLLDWGANGDIKDFQALGKVVDEVVIQIYQGRRVIPGYGTYLSKLDRFNVPFKIGLLQGEEWVAPKGLTSNPMFKGFVVFLVNPKI